MLVFRGEPGDRRIFSGLMVEALCRGISVVMLTPQATDPWLTPWPETVFHLDTLTEKPRSTQITTFREKKIIEYLEYQDVNLQSKDPARGRRNLEEG